MSSTEKLFTNHNEPLILRPPVGSEVNQPLGVKSILTRLHRRENRRRFGLLYSLLLLCLLIAVVLLFLAFVWRIGPFANSGPNFLHYSTCRILVPEAGTSSLERIAVDPDALTVNLSDYPTSSFSQIRIVHLPKLALTVVRTQLNCYMRFMRPDLKEALERGYEKLLSSGIGLRVSVTARLQPTRWCLAHPSLSAEYLHELHPRLAQLCSGVPTYHLTPCSEEEVSELPNMPPSETVDGNVLCPQPMCGPNCEVGFSRDGGGDGGNGCPVCRCPPMQAPPIPVATSGINEVDRRKQDDDTDDEDDSNEVFLALQRSQPNLLRGSPYQLHFRRPMDNGPLGSNGIVDGLPPPVGPIPASAGDKILAIPASAGDKILATTTHVERIIPASGLVGEKRQAIPAMLRARRAAGIPPPASKKAKKCQLADVFVEDATIPLEKDSEFVTLTQDVVYSCPPKLAKEVKATDKE